MKSVAIVGAGFAGLVTAKILKQYGFRVSVFEKEPEVGGVWASSRAYPGLTTQNPKDTYFLSDLKMDRSYPEWPQGYQVQQYLENYVDHCRLRENIRLQTEVKKAELTDDNKWKIETLFKKGKESQVSIFDLLIVCNGTFSDPFIPSYEGIENFRANGGQVLHSSQTSVLQPTSDKNIVVVGYGKSSCDIASAVSDHCRSTTVVARSIIWKIPKKFFGFVNMKYLLLSRMGENLFEHITLSGFPKFLHGAGKSLRNSMLSNIESILTWQLKLKQSDLHPEKSIDTIARANASLVSDNFFTKVIAKKIVVKKGHDIVRLEKGKAVLDNGEKIDADIIVCGTGYYQRVPFFDATLTSKILDHHGDFRLYRNQLPVDVPNLAFNGYSSSFYCQLNSEIGAIWLAEHFTTGFKIPSPEVCNAIIDERLVWSKERSGGKNAKGTSVTPFSLTHIDELLNDIGMNVSIFTRFMQWFVPANPGSYASVIKKVVRRFETERRKSFVQS